MSTAGRYRLWAVALCCMGLVAGGWGASAIVSDVIRVGAFSERTPTQGMPEGWRPYSLASVYEKTDYELVRTERGVVVRAQSEGEGSALVTKRRIDVTKHPIVEWHWKVDTIIPEADIRVGARSDYPASLFVTFDYRDVGLYRRLKILTLEILGYDSVPTRAIVYVWANRVERSTVVPNSKAEWMKMVVVRSGTTDVGTWTTERRNVRDDYRSIFGEAPPPVKRIAIMTATKDTKARATAYYGDVTFRSAASDSTAAPPVSAPERRREPGLSARSDRGGP